MGSRSPPGRPPEPRVRSPTVHSRCSHRLVHFHTRRSPCWEHLQQALRVWATVLRCARLSPVHPQSSKLLHRSTGNLDVAAGQVAVPRPQYWCRAATAIEPTAPNRPRHSRPWRCRRPSRPHARCQLCRHSSHGVAAVRSIASKEHVVAICLSPQPRLEHRLSATPRLRITDCPTGGWLLGIHWPGERPSGAQAVCGSSLL